MPLEKAKTRAQLLKEIRKAVKEAKEAGVSDAQELVKKIIEAKQIYITWKNLGLKNNVIIIILQTSWQTQGNFGRNSVRSPLALEVVEEGLC